jgi:RES domain-containing protein
MDEIKRLLDALSTISSTTIRQRLVRCVERDALESNQPPAFLFTSGKPNRYNPAGIECVYFSENLEAATLEYERFQQASGLDPVAFTTYYADAELPFLDLTVAETLDRLGLVQVDLHASWRLSRNPTKTQLLGAAVAQQERFAAIRFPSDAARVAGKIGCNFVIFRDSIRAPAFLRVLTGKLIPVQEWP